MTDKPPASVLRILVIVMLVGSLGCIASGAWLMATDQGAPVFVLLGGAMLGALASIIAGQLRKS
jgi:hypothetical protein